MLDGQSPKITQQIEAYTNWLLFSDYPHTIAPIVSDPKIENCTVTRSLEDEIFRNNETNRELHLHSFTFFCTLRYNKLVDDTSKLSRYTRIDRHRKIFRFNLQLYVYFKTDYKQKQPNRNNNPLFGRFNKSRLFKETKANCSDEETTHQEARRMSRKNFKWGRQQLQFRKLHFVIKA